ncbi:adenosylcobalamin-dependent ribonucleoside-diphosphate reductase [Candidatus Woesearchaeota archaeon]|nr:adenosylcobalamin-dependent ribonucleoside-diphosphate reductase [Candidatus Woesearchaeota archaeon]
MLGHVKKRDGTTVKFEKEKITNAIFKAVKAVGGKDKKTASSLADQVVMELEKTLKPGLLPTVEEVQDTVEKVLIENGHAKTAKAYILYRQKRSELRNEKASLLEKQEIDEVDKRFDVNALRVLKARYLRKDEKGKLRETPKELFTRVAVHTALPDLIFDTMVFDKSASQKKHEEPKPFSPEEWEGKINIGKYSLNRYHLEGLKRMHERISQEGKAKTSFPAFIESIRQGRLDRYEKTIDKFYSLMVERKFMPNTPAVANFGNPLGMGSACFVLGIEDSMDSIMDTLKHTAIIHKSGGGTGFNFSKLRPEGDYVSSTSGVASGPMSFMRMFDTMTEVVKQGGIRRGANMGILNSNHPDIEKFITAKEGNKGLRNFNISVLIMPDFWEYYDRNQPYPLINPRNGEAVRTVNPRMLFDLIVYQAWESAEPGVIFHDHVNKYNPFYEHLGPIVTTNPCGEVLLYPDEPCNLGSINVLAFAKEDEEGRVYFDWEELAKATLDCTHFLDNVIDVNKYPLPQIERMSLNTRKIGLGVMGVANLLYELGLAYNSDTGRSFMGRLMEFVNYYSKVQSIEMAAERGPMPYYDKSFYQHGKMPFSGAYSKEKRFNWDEIAQKARSIGIRNGFTTVIAPTGSISMIAGCSSGIEPVYSLVFEKNVAVGNFFYADHVFENIIRKEGIYSEELMKEVVESGGSVQRLETFPERLKELFVTAMDITPEDHIRALAEFQKWTDSSISKTNNFPANATVEDMRQSYIMAYRFGCKDVTVFRDTSIRDQVLVAPKKKEIAAEKHQHIKVMAHGAQETNGETGKDIKECPECSGANVEKKEGCVTCADCGWGACT